MQVRSQESTCMGVGQWKEYRRCFWVAENVLFLDLSAGSMGVFSSGKSSRGTLTICTLVWVDVWWGREEGRGRRRRISYFPSIQNILGASLVVRWLRHCAASAGGLGSIPGPGTRSQMLQLRVCMPQLKRAHMHQGGSKIPHVATNTWCSQIKT